MRKKTPVDDVFRSYTGLIPRRAGAAAEGGVESQKKGGTPPGRDGGVAGNPASPPEHGQGFDPGVPAEERADRGGERRRWPRRE
jgi:hypothetical protein